MGETRPQPVGETHKPDTLSLSPFNFTDINF